MSGFGDSLVDALRELAKNLVREAVWIEIADRAELTFEPTVLTGGVIQTNVIGLYYKENGICAFAGAEDSYAGVAGFGNSVHEALRELADNLVTHGVWIEVTDEENGIWRVSTRQRTWMISIRWMISRIWRMRHGDLRPALGI